MLPPTAGGGDAAMSDAPVPARPRRVDLTRGHLLRGIVLLSWPVVVSSLLQFLLGVVDTKMVGALGPAAIAAVGTSRTAIMTLMAAVLAVSTGTQVLTGHFAGRRQPEMVAAVTRQAIIISVLLGLILGPLGWVLARPIMAALGASDQVLAQATAYTRAFFVGAIALMVNFMIASALNGVGDTLTPLYVLAGVNAGNILLDWLLIFGIGPFPRLGVAGAAWAVVISRTIGAMVLLWIVSCGRFAIRMPLRGSWRLDFGLWGRLFYIGTPSSIQGFTRNFSFLAVLWILNHTHAAHLAVAGHTIAAQVQMIMIVVGLAFMSAAMTAVSQNMGAGSPRRAEHSGWIVAAISTALISAVAGIVMLVARPLVAFFTDDKQTIGWGVIALRIMSASQPFTAASMAFSGALRGAGDTLSPLYVSLVFTSGLAPALAYIFAIPAGLGPTGTWIGMATAIVFQAAALAAIFRRGKWKAIRIEHGRVRDEAAPASRPKVRPPCSGDKRSGPQG